MAEEIPTEVRRRTQLEAEVAPSVRGTTETIAKNILAAAGDFTAADGRVNVSLHLITHGGGGVAEAEVGCRPVAGGERDGYRIVPSFQGEGKCCSGRVCARHFYVMTYAQNWHACCKRKSATLCNILQPGPQNWPEDDRSVRCSQNACQRDFCLSKRMSIKEFRRTKEDAPESTAFPAT